MSGCAAGACAAVSGWVEGAAVSGWMPGRNWGASAAVRGCAAGVCAATGGVPTRGSAIVGFGAAKFWTTIRKIGIKDIPGV